MREAIRKGTQPFATRENGSPVIPQAVYKLAPTGGVMRPIAMFMTRTTQRWIGSIFRLRATGSRMGTKM